MDSLLQLGRAGVKANQAAVSQSIRKFPSLQPFPAGVVDFTTLCVLDSSTKPSSDGSRLVVSGATIVHAKAEWI
jgi:hypothetical protein